MSVFSSNKCRKLYIWPVSWQPNNILRTLSVLNALNVQCNASYIQVLAFTISDVTVSQVFEHAIHVQCTFIMVKVSETFINSFYNNYCYSLLSSGVSCIVLCSHSLSIAARTAKRLRQINEKGKLLRLILTMRNWLVLQTRNKNTLFPLSFYKLPSEKRKCTYLPLECCMNVLALTVLYFFCFIQFWSVCEISPKSNLNSVSSFWLWNGFKWWNSIGNNNNHSSKVMTSVFHDMKVPCLFRPHRYHHTTIIIWKLDGEHTKREKQKYIEKYRRCSMPVHATAT